MSKIACVAALLLLSVCAIAQKRPLLVKGRVLNYYTHKPVSNIIVQIRGQYNDTMTDADGTFALRVIGRMPKKVIVEGNPRANPDIFVTSDSILVAALHNGKEVTLYEFRTNKISPLLDRCCKPSPYRREDDIALPRGQLLPAIIPYVLVLHNTPWQRITHPFKKRQHE